MGGRIREFDWASSPVGPLDEWPRALRTAIGILLGSRYPLYIAWGPQFIQFYNDGYRPILGSSKHPDALGRSTRETFAEIWDYIGPMFERVLAKGEPTWREDQLLPLDRFGYLEECYFTFSYSAVPDDTGKPGGVFVAVTEQTERILGTRRLATLREIATRADNLDSDLAACEGAAGALGTNRADLPFVLLYLVEGDRANLAGSTLPAGWAVPSSVSLDPAEEEEEDGWRIARVFADQRMELIDDVVSRLGSVPADPWPESVTSAAVLPIARLGMDAPAGVLVAGLSPRRPFDDAYRGFLDLVAGHIGTAIASARARAEELRRAEELADLNRAKTTFFSNISHEFRTPLTLMLGPLETVLEEAGSMDPTNFERIRMARNNAIRLLKLVNTLLDFSTHEAGRLLPSFEPTDLAALTASVASLFRSAIECEGIRFTVDCPQLPAAAYVDRSMWEKILLNLLSNALKYTFDGEISVRLRRDRSHIELEVSDTGTGIPESDVGRIFDRFHRVTDTRARTHEGSGIGLTFARELARLHGGDIRCESELDAGSRFVVSIPAGRAHLPPEHIRAAPAAVQPADPQLVANAQPWLPRSDGARPARREPETLQDGRSRLLVVDDNADMRDYLVTLLDEQYAVTTAADGLSAIETARRMRPDLVLADVMMPGLDGLGLVNAIREDASLRDTPVILLSARAGADARASGLESGADDYLVKPFSAAEVRARISASLRLRALREKSRADLEASERRFHEIFDRARIGILVLGDDAVIAEANPAMCDMLGQPADALTNSCLSDWTSPGNDERMQVVRAALRDGSEWRGELEMKRADDRVLVLDWHISPPAFPGYHVATAMDITNRHRNEVGLREANRRKDEFLAVLGHELRNPFAVIRNSVQLLNMLGPDDNRLQWARDVIDRQVGHMVRLVDDLLDVSRIAHGKISLRREHVSLASVIGQGVESARPIIDERGHVLRSRVEPGPITIEGDPTRLAQAISNLLTNAARYTPEGGRIELNAGFEDGFAVIRVTDNGMGMEDEDLAHIFDLFAQVRTGTEAEGGLGIGLTLVRSIVELHEGTVEASSDGRGKGSTFVIRLPAARSVATPVPTPAPDISDPVRRRVLIADDNVPAAESLGLLLELEGHEVRVTNDGLAAVAEAKRFVPEVVLLDLTMPGMDGFAAASRIRELIAPPPRILAMTGFADSATLRRVMEHGFDDVLVKPVDPDTLANVILGSSRISATTP